MAANIILSAPMPINPATADGLRMKSARLDFDTGIVQLEYDLYSGGQVIARDGRVRSAPGYVTSQHDIMKGELLDELGVTEA